MKSKEIKLLEQLSLGELLTPNDIERLHHTSMRSFLSEQKNRFEVIDTKDDLGDKEYEELQDSLKEWWVVNEKDCSMYTYHSQLEWLIAFNYYTKVKKTKAIKVIDLSEVKEYGDDSNLHILIVEIKYI